MSNPGSMSQEVPVLPFAYDFRTPHESALKLMYAVSPEWESRNGLLKIEQLHGGLMNSLFKLSKHLPAHSEEEIESAAILVRVYGTNTDSLVNRNVEAASHLRLAEPKLAAPLLARFENGLLYRFTPGKVCSAIDLTKETTWRAVAMKIGEWHAKLSNPDAPTQQRSESASNAQHETQNGGLSIGAHSLLNRQPSRNIWKEMYQWISILPTNNQAQLERKRLLKAEIETSFMEIDSTSGLGERGYIIGHTDLTSVNIIMRTNQPSQNSLQRTTSVVTELTLIAFIDYEYVQACSAAFELATHFSEWGGFECDYTMLPSRQTRRAFIEEYLDSYIRHAPWEKENIDRENMIQTLLRDVDRYRGIPGFRWSLHSMIEESLRGTDVDFDWNQYAELRLGEYWVYRREMDGSRAASGAPMPLRERMWAREV